MYVLKRCDTDVKIPDNDVLMLKHLSGSITIIIEH